MNTQSMTQCSLTIESVGGAKYPAVVLRQMRQKGWANKFGRGNEIDAMDTATRQGELSVMTPERDSGVSRAAAIEDTEDDAVATGSRSPSPELQRRRRRLTREELAPEAREAILRAAMEVVGEHGYANATIARVTNAAGIAQGTFYLYFDSRQALFDELLPDCGQRMLDFIRKRVSGARDIFEKEERGFRAFFEYMKANPAFFRILTEAAGAAPNAHARHFELVTRPYVETLRRAQRAGQMGDFGDGDLEAVAYMLMAAREYLYLRHIKNAKDERSSLEEAVQIYMKFVRRGLGKK